MDRSSSARRGLVAAACAVLALPALAHKKRQDEPGSGAGGGGAGSGAGGKSGSSGPAGGTQSAAAQAGQANANARQNKEITGAAQSHSKRKDRKETGHER
jgi:hypothetical protein